MKKPFTLETLARHALRAAGKGHRWKWSDPYGRPPVPHLGAPFENYGRSAVCRCGATLSIDQGGQRGAETITITPEAVNTCTEHNLPF